MEFYVKVKPSCDNCFHLRGVALDPKEEPRWYCAKSGDKMTLPEDKTCDDFIFDATIERPTVISKDVWVRKVEE